ncbi:sister chromatid cohesion protein PDS5 [Amycolatopsis marina]|nr:sister chromatid cohesion protein PDS5 [Amycolatopsis marina]
MVEASMAGGGKRMVSMRAPVAKGTGAPMPAEGGGYKFDPEQLDEVIRKWKALRDDLKNDATDAELMASVQAPGREFASGDFEKTANPSGQAFLEQNLRMQQYVQDYIEALENAKKGTENTEDDMREQINKAGADQA